MPEVSGAISGDFWCTVTWKLQKIYTWWPSNFAVTHLIALHRKRRWSVLVFYFPSCSRSILSVTRTAFNPAHFNCHVTSVEYVMVGSHSAANAGPNIPLDIPHSLNHELSPKLKLIVLRRDIMTGATVCRWEKSMTKQAMNPGTWRELELPVVAFWSRCLNYHAMYTLWILWCRLWVGKAAPVQTLCF